MSNKQKIGILAGMLGFAVLDQLSKAWALASLPPEQSIPLIPGVFQLTLAYNTGAAFSILRHQPQLLTLMTSLIFLVLLAYGLWRRPLLRWEASGFALILGGALGNLIDRFRAGKVTDFFDFIWIHYPVFNVADSLIFCGVILLVMSHFLPVRPSAEAKSTTIAPSGTP